MTNRSKRRHFLQTSLVFFPILGGSLSALAQTQDAKAIASANLSSISVGSKRLVVVMLRGAIDGLSVVVPYTESNYYRQRPDIAIAPPGQIDGSLELDARFGLHPSLAMLKPLWDAKQLSFVHASGSPLDTRSHFEAQDRLETATIEQAVVSTQTGWLNRLANALNNQKQGSGALNLGPVMPRILVGNAPVVSLASGASARQLAVFDQPKIGAEFVKLYADDPKLDKALRGAAQSRQLVAQGSDMAMTGDQADLIASQADRGAIAISAFAQDARSLGNAMRKDARMRIGFIAVGGWDTHVNQGAAKGTLANKLAQLGAGLVTLKESLGERFSDTTIVVMSEFGRTLKQNGNQGTDHGRANVIWLMGGAIVGGKVFGQWPGLQDEQLTQNRDLTVTTDFRDVIAQTLRLHLQQPDEFVARVLPDYRNKDFNEIYFRT
jgi:uncharacterized protein (DUF1501 family)